MITIFDAFHNKECQHIRYAQMLLEAQAEVNERKGSRPDPKFTLTAIV